MTCHQLNIHCTTFRLTYGVFICSPKYMDMRAQMSKRNRINSSIRNKSVPLGTQYRSGPPQNWIQPETCSPRLTTTPRVPHPSPPDRAMGGEPIPSTRHRGCCRCPFLARYSLLVTRCWFTNRLCPSPRPPRPSALSASVFHKPPSYSPIPTPKLFFTLLLSKIACQAPKPTKKPITHPINKIKLSPKRFLVMVNPVQLN